MAFQRALIQGFRLGSNLIAPADQIPDGGVRLLENARLTHPLGVITNRAGMVEATDGPLAVGPVRMMWTLFGENRNTRYVQVDTKLYRLDEDWDDKDQMLDDLDRAVSAVNMTDGKEGLHAYFTSGGSGGASHKDTGTIMTTWGIAKPANPPSLVVLATDLSTLICAFDSALLWTTANLTAGPTVNTTIKQAGTSSITVTVAAGTLGSLARSVTLIDLDLLTDGDETVKDDDYIHLWVRADRPDRVAYLQLDFDLDTATVADAFKDNVYSINLQSSIWLNQGRDQWSKIQVAKSRFTRSGTDTALTWATVKAWRLSVLTTNNGPVQLYVDDLKLRGGTDLVGSVRYTACYRARVTGARGNPPLDEEHAVVYTEAIDTDRQRLRLTISNLLQGGVDHPGDTQITQIRIYRSIDEGDALQIAQIDDTDLSPYRDETTMEAALLATVLETDNDMPPAGHTVFGPGALNRLFMLVGRNSLRFSKAWELNENRVENWPLDFEAKIGDGSELALTGLVSDSTVLVWSDQRTYTVQGYGEDTFLPIPVPNSRGAVGRFAVTEGDGRIFFVSQDGLYEQAGQQQRRLTDTIAPFFAGLTVYGQEGWNTDPATQRLICLTWQPDPLAPFLLMLYPSAEALGLDRELYIGKNPGTGQYTDISFDSRRGGFHLLSLYRDSERNVTYGGGGNGQVYQLEAPTVHTDAGEDMRFRVVTRSEPFGAPHKDKYVTQALLEMQTNEQLLTALALYDKQQVSEVLSTAVWSTSATSTIALPVLGPEVMRQDMALEVSGLITNRVELSRYGWMYEVQPEALTLWDSGQQDFGAQTIIQGLWYTVMSTQDIVVTFYLDAAIMATYHIPTTSGRRDADRFFCVPGTKGRLLRITLSSTEPFRLYALHLRSKPYGAAQAYQEASLLTQGDAG